VRRNSPKRLAGSPGDQHAEHVRPRVVQPSLPRLIEQRQRGKPAHPFVGRGRPLRFRRTAAQSELAHGLEQRLGPGRLEVHPEPERERQDIANRDRPASRDGVAVKWTAPIDEHPSVGELGDQRVHRILETQLAVLDQEQRPDSNDRLGHGGDAENAVPTNGFGFAAGEAAGDADLDVVAAGRQPRNAADAVLFHMTRHHVAQVSEPAWIESAHAGMTLWRRRSHRRGSSCQVHHSYGGVWGYPSGESSHSSWRPSAVRSR
jgi:hypothetical protein